MNHDFTRTDVIQFHLKNNSFKKHLLNFLCIQSKAIFNSAIYFQRQMFNINEVNLIYIKYFLN